MQSQSPGSETARGAGSEPAPRPRLVAAAVAGPPPERAPLSPQEIRPGVQHLREPHHPPRREGCLQNRVHGKELPRELLQVRGECSGGRVTPAGRVRSPARAPPAGAGPWAGWGLGGQMARCPLAGADENGKVYKQGVLARMEVKPALSQMRDSGEAGGDVTGDTKQRR